MPLICTSGVPTGHEAGRSTCRSVLRQRGLIEVNSPDDFSTAPPATRWTIEGEAAAAKKSARASRRRSSSTTARGMSRLQTASVLVTRSRQCSPSQKQIDADLVERVQCRRERSAPERVPRRAWDPVDLESHVGLSVDVLHERRPGELGGGEVARWQNISKGRR